MLARQNIANFVEKIHSTAPLPEPETKQNNFIEILKFYELLNQFKLNLLVSVRKQPLSGLVECGKRPQSGIK